MYVSVWDAAELLKSAVRPHTLSKRKLYVLDLTILMSRSTNDQKQFAST